MAKAGFILSIFCKHCTLGSNARWKCISTIEGHLVPEQEPTTEPKQASL